MCNLLISLRNTRLVFCYLLEFQKKKGFKWKSELPDVKIEMGVARRRIGVMDVMHIDFFFFLPPSSEHKNKRSRRRRQRRSLLIYEKLLFVSAVSFLSMLNLALWTSVLGNLGPVTVRNSAQRCVM